MRVERFGNVVVGNVEVGGNVGRGDGLDGVGEFYGEPALDSTVQEERIDLPKSRSWSGVMGGLNAGSIAAPRLNAASAVSAIVKEGEKEGGET